MPPGKWQECTRGLECWLIPKSPFNKNEPTETYFRLAICDAKPETGRVIFSAIIKNQRQLIELKLAAVKLQRNDRNHFDVQLYIKHAELRYVQKNQFPIRCLVGFGMLHGSCRLRMMQRLGPTGNQWVKVVEQPTFCAGIYVPDPLGRTDVNGDTVQEPAWLGCCGGCGKAVWVTAGFGHQYVREPGPGNKYTKHEDAWVATQWSTRFKSYKSTIIIVICCRIIVIIVLKKSASRVVTVGHNYNCDNCADKCGNCADNCGNCDDNCDNCDMR